MVSLNIQFPRENSRNIFYLLIIAIITTRKKNTKAFFKKIKGKIYFKLNNLEN